MDQQKYTLASLRQELTDNNLHVKAIIQVHVAYIKSSQNQSVLLHWMVLFFLQDILAFQGSIVELETYNEAGRAKLSALRKCIERMNEWASDEGDPALYKEVDTHRQQFSR